MTEEWRDIPSLKGMYQASNLGRIRSVDRRVWNGRGSYIRPGVVLNPYPVGLYLQVAVAGRRRSVHQLILEAFDRPAADGEECRHLDGDGTNNVLANLVWGTRSENTHDQVRMGIHVQARKTHCPEGHPYNAENTYRGRNGGRQCRICRRARWHEWNTNRKAKAAA